MKKIIGILLAGGIGAFAVTFLIYMFNLDMKFMAYVVDPILQKNYDARKKNYYV